MLDLVLMPRLPPAAVVAAADAETLRQRHERLHAMPPCHCRRYYYYMLPDTPSVSRCRWLFFFFLSSRLPRRRHHAACRASYHEHERRIMTPNGRTTFLIFTPDYYAASHQTYIVSPPRLSRTGIIRFISIITPSFAMPTPPRRAAYYFRHCRHAIHASPPVEVDQYRERHAMPPL